MCGDIFLCGQLILYVLLFADIYAAAPQGREVQAQLMRVHANYPRGPHPGHSTSRHGRGGYASPQVLCNPNPDPPQVL